MIIFWLPSELKNSHSSALHALLKGRELFKHERWGSSCCMLFCFEGKEKKAFTVHTNMSKTWLSCWCHHYIFTLLPSSAVIPLALYWISGGSVLVPLVVQFTRSQIKPSSFHLGLYLFIERNTRGPYDDHMIWVIDAIIHALPAVVR